MVAVGEWGGAVVGLMDNMRFGGRVGELRVRDDVEMIAAGEPVGQQEANGMRDLDDFDVGEVEVEDGEDVAMEQVHLESAVAPEVGSTAVAERPVVEASASGAAVQLERVQAASVVLALAPGDPAVAEAKHTLVVVKADVETAEEGKQLDLDSAVEAVQGSEEKTVPAAMTNIVEQHVPTTSRRVHQYSATTQTQYAKQEATESPQAQPSPVRKMTTLQHPMKRNDFV